MIKCLCLVLALAAALFVPAAAESGMPEGVSAIEEGVPVSLDADGDGAAETVLWSMLSDGDEPRLQLRVISEGGDEAVFDTDILYGGSVGTADLNGDGILELLATGDMMSDDYCTYCLHYTDGRLAETLFADAGRGVSGNGYFKAGYGRLTALDPQTGAVTLTGSQDVLGTWFGSRTFRLSPNGLLEFADGGQWIREYDPEDPELWEYAALTPVREIRCADGSSLAAGETFIVTASDKCASASFLTREGRTGTLSICEDEQRGWGWTVDGIPEEELFERVPYAD
ncbi:MAG: hypothetical protein IKE30_08625 [Clostridia bacterium]|nr:hypothetical protein [Clostridia bacterium]